MKRHSPDPGTVESSLQRGPAPPPRDASSTRPPLSVVMPVHNALPWLDEAVESILSQTFRDFEFVILDDGSSDGSRQRVRAWADRDPRIRLIESDSRLGPVGSSNRVVAESTAALVARMDADDVAAPHRLERQMAAMAARKDAVIVGALSDIIDGSGRRVRGADYPRLLRRSGFAPFSHPTILFRREVFDQVGGYHEDAALWEDVDLYLRMLGAGPVLVVPEPLVSVRYASASTRVEIGDERLEQAMDAMYRRVNESLGTPEKPSAASFVASASIHLWAGRASRVFSRLSRSASVGLDRESIAALAWAAWAQLSPLTLRWTLRTLLAVRTPLARRRLGAAELLEWRPGEPPRAA